MTDKDIQDAYDYTKRAARYWHEKHGQIYPVSDYESEGMAALAGCIDRYDSSKSTKLTTYINPRVNGAMRDLIRTRLGRDGNYHYEEPLEWDDDYVKPFYAEDDTEAFQVLTDSQSILNGISSAAASLITEAFSGSTQREMAAKTSWSEVTVTRQVNRILAKLRLNALRRSR